MTYVAAGLIGAVLGMALAYVVVVVTFRAERRKRGGDISESAHAFTTENLRNWQREMRAAGKDRR